jgi:hypothetical protein
LSFVNISFFWASEVAVNVDWNDPTCDITTPATVVAIITDAMIRMASVITLAAMA